MADMAPANAIRRAVEVQGPSWDARGRIGTPDGLADQLVLALAAAPDMAEPNCVAAIIGESAQETDWFCSLTEYGGPNTRYAPYYGRGCIQLTWSSNYRGFGQWLHKMDMIGDPEFFVQHPDAVTQWPYPWLSAIYYFVQHIPMSYIRSGNWNAVSGLINAGNAGYYVPAYELRANSINAALAQLGSWTFNGGDNMSLSDEDIDRIRDRVLGTMITRAGLPDTDSRAGQAVRLCDIFAWLDAAFTNIPAAVWGHEVTRAGLPESDPRADKPVSVGTIMAYQDSFVANIIQVVQDAVASITDGDTAQKVVAAVNTAMDKYIRLRATEPGTIAAMPLPNEIYVISAGETLKAIAQAHGTTVTDITRANPGLEPNQLVAGQHIIIPGIKSVV